VKRIVKNFGLNAIETSLKCRHTVRMLTYYVSQKMSLITDFNNFLHIA